MTNFHIRNPYYFNCIAWHPKAELTEPKIHCLLKTIESAVMFNLLGVFLASLPAMALQPHSKTTRTKGAWVVLDATKLDKKKASIDCIFSELESKSTDTITQQLNSTTLTDIQKELILHEAENTNKYESVSVCIVANYSQKIIKAEKEAAIAGEKPKKPTPEKVATEAEDASTNKESFFSDTFIAGSENGSILNRKKQKKYRLRTRIYPNGDGMGRGTHFSLFFSLAGESDHGLPWPYDREIYFKILDQSGENEHIKDAFRTNLESSSWMRPKSSQSINRASGDPKFTDKDKLEASGKYLINDVLLIAVATKKRKIILPATPGMVQRIVGAVRNFLK